MNMAFMARTLMEKVAAQKLDPLVKEVLLCEQLPAGLRRLKERHVHRKLIVKM